MLINLSYPLSESTPFYKGLQGPKLQQLYDLAKGDVCNSFYLTTSNHAGTHVDGPNHFNPTGRKISEYELSDLVFTRAVVLDVKAGRDELILPEHLAGAEECRNDCDLLLLRTGFGRYRFDAETYIEHNLGISAAAANYLMQHFAGLKAVAVDFPSVAAMNHMEEGCEAHRIFLGCGDYSERPVLLIEDVRVAEILPRLHNVYLIPWLFEGLDSAPCTLFAEIDDETIR